MPYDNRYNNNPRMGGQGQRGGANGSRRQDNDITTNGVILHNERVGRFLRTRFWNNTLGLDIGVYPPGSPPNYETVRNAQVFGHVFSFSTIFELKDVCEEVLLSLRETNTFESTAVVAGIRQDSIVEISNGSNINMTPGIYLVIYKNVDSGKRSNTYEIYPFSATKVLRGYDHSSGRANEDIKANGNFKKFVKILDEAANAFTMAQAHIAAEVKKSDKLATFTALSAISAALGVDTQKTITSVLKSGYSRQQQQSGQYQRKSQPGQWSPNGYKNGDNSAPQQQSNYSQQQAAMAAIVDEPVDINLDAATLQNVDFSQFANG